MAIIMIILIQLTQKGFKTNTIWMTSVNAAYACT